ncbi:uncharacterized protein LOC123690055 [Pieris rapae]|uniref:uncharacterized protein LOC123690055 n=1 Tax=Pieris rapae TaxID=64459 RepID=UPI001E27AAB8|nr:uncharacterized protein LOC123690055 [Pieris rapae]
MFERYPVEEIIELMAQNAAQVAYHSFKWQYTTLILFNASCLYGLDVFVKLYDKNIKLYNVIESVPDLKSVDVNQFILFVADVAETQAVINAIERQNLNANAKFIIICKHRTECNEAQAVKILWTYRIFNVIFIKNEDSLISGYTYFRNERCDHPIPRRLEHWDKCINFSKKVIKLCKKQMFPPKFRNFHRCPLIVSTFEQRPFMYINDGVPYGADGDLLRCIVHTLNATLVLISPRDDGGWGSFENNTWTGSLGDVYNDLANVSMTSASITFNRLKYFDISINYNSLDLVWVTHLSEFESSSHKLLKPFTGKARGLFVVTFMIPLIIHILLKLRIMEKIKTRFNIGLSSDSFLIYALQISLGFSVTKYPKNFYKHVFLFWVWYWFFVRTLYQVYLIHSLHADVPLNTINTLRDAIEEGYQYR